jgi:PAS domain S-box-containing protein
MSMPNTGERSMVILYLVSPILSAGLFIAIAVYAWRHRDMHSAASFAWLMTYGSIWAGGFALQVLSPNETVARLIDKVYFTGIVLLPVAWVFFALFYTDSWRWPRRRVMLLLVVIPFISLVLNWTDSLYPLFVKELTFRRRGFLLIPHRVNGAWFYVHAIYNYVLIAAGMFLLVRQAVQTFAIYRMQALALIVGAITPIIPNVLVTFQWVEIPITYAAFAVSGLVFALALFRYRLLDLVPVARERLIDNMSAGMLLLDAQDRVLDFNPAMQTLLDLPNARVIGKQVTALLQNHARLLRYLQSGQEMQTEITVTKNGDVRYYDLRISVMRDHLDQVTGRLIILHDITKRKKSEAALQQYTVELEESNAELDAFAHTVAHDLKTPLAALVGYSSLLVAKHTKFSEETLTNNLQMMARSSRKMANIIDELLLLASVRKVEDVKTYPLKMGAIVADALQRLDDMIMDYDAEISVPDDWPRAIGYGPWVEEIWANYLSNALKYGGTPRKVKLGADLMQKEGTTWVRFWVQDNGPGLTEEEQRRLFAQFERLNQMRMEGHGLGLSIVQRIVSKLRGEVGVESEIGEGSLFWFTLPVAAPDQDAATSSGALHSPGWAEHGVTV